MTPQERQMVDELFDRLAKLETSPRDPDADSAITAGLRRAPNAAYALVQTVLVQDEALRRANDRIAELENHGSAQSSSGGGFLDSMRGAFGLEPTQARGSVPSVRPSGTDSGRTVWNSGQVLGSAPQSGGGAYADPRAGGGYADPRSGALTGGGGSSFLGTAAAAAAGMIGGSLLMNSIRGLGGGFGGNHQSLSDTSAGGDKSNPWSTDQSNGNLARDAGVNDIGKSASADNGQRQNGFDQAQADADQDSDQDQDDDDFDSGDSGSDDSGFA